ncbi:MAG: metallophosphoesterase [Verrucomicrobia bacterium]|nr:metallophosphoesterase [Verrucomicrobiota bacterium]
MSTFTRRRFLKVSTVAAAGLPFVSRGAAAAGAGFEIGLVTDAQYADIEAKGTRYYRASVGRLAEAVEHFNGRDLAFCAHLGDLIDQQWKSFDEITKPLAASRHRFHHLLGNHDFDVLDELKPRVPERLAMQRRYRSFAHEGFQFVILDTNDVSTYAHRAGTPEHAAAAEELARVKAAKATQAQPWNGGIGAVQLAWFDRTCTEARATGRKVIVFAHHPVAPANVHNVWNDAAVLAVIDRHPHVVVWLNGHNHAGNFAERNGVPYVTMHGMVETPGTTAFATARLLPDRLVLTGHGREPSRELVFRRTG